MAQLRHLGSEQLYYVVFSHRSRRDLISGVCRCIGICFGSLSSGDFIPALSKSPDAGRETEQKSIPVDLHYRLLDFRDAEYHRGRSAAR